MNAPAAATTPTNAPSSETTTQGYSNLTTTNVPSSNQSQRLDQAAEINLQERMSQALQQYPDQNGLSTSLIDSGNKLSQSSNDNFRQAGQEFKAAGQNVTENNYPGAADHLYNGANKLADGLGLVDTAVSQARSNFILGLLCDFTGISDIQNGLHAIGDIADAIKNHDNQKLAMAAGALAMAGVGIALTFGGGGIAKAGARVAEKVGLGLSEHALASIASGGIKYAQNMGVNLAEHFLTKEVFDAVRTKASTAAADFLAHAGEEGVDAAIKNLDSTLGSNKEIIAKIFGNQHSADKIIADTVNNELKALRSSNNITQDLISKYGFSSEEATQFAKVFKNGTQDKLLAEQFTKVISSKMEERLANQFRASFEKELTGQLTEASISDKVKEEIISRQSEIVDKATQSFRRDLEKDIVEHVSPGVEEGIKKFRREGKDDNSGSTDDSQPETKRASISRQDLTYGDSTFQVNTQIEHNREASMAGHNVELETANTGTISNEMVSNQLPRPPETDVHIARQEASETGAHGQRKTSSTQTQTTSTT